MWQDDFINLFSASSEEVYPNKITKITFGVNSVYTCKRDKNGRLGVYGDRFIVTQLGSGGEPSSRSEMVVCAAMASAEIELIIISKFSSTRRGRHELAPPAPSPGNRRDVVSTSEESEGGRGVAWQRRGEGG